MLPWMPQASPGRLMSCGRSSRESAVQQLSPVTSQQPQSSQALSPASSGYPGSMERMRHPSNSGQHEDFRQTYGHPHIHRNSSTSKFGGSGSNETDASNMDMRNMSQVNAYRYVPQKLHMQHMLRQSAMHEAMMNRTDQPKHQQPQMHQQSSKQQRMQEKFDHFSKVDTRSNKDQVTEKRMTVSVPLNSYPSSTAERVQTSPANNWSATTVSRHGHPTQNNYNSLQMPPAVPPKSASVIQVRDKESYSPPLDLSLSRKRNSRETGSTDQPLDLSVKKKKRERDESDDDVIVVGYQNNGGFKPQTGGLSQVPTPKPYHPSHIFSGRQMNAMGKMDSRNTVCNSPCPSGKDFSKFNSIVPQHYQCNQPYSRQHCESQKVNQQATYMDRRSDDFRSAESKDVKITGESRLDSSKKLPYDGWGSNHRPSHPDIQYIPESSASIAAKPYERPPYSHTPRTITKVLNPNAIHPNMERAPVVAQIDRIQNTYKAEERSDVNEHKDSYQTHASDQSKAVYGSAQMVNNYGELVNKRSSGTGPANMDKSNDRVRQHSKTRIADRARDCFIGPNSCNYGDQARVTKNEQMKDHQIQFKPEYSMTSNYDIQRQMPNVETSNYNQKPMNTSPTFMPNQNALDKSHAKLQDGFCPSTKDYNKDIDKSQVKTEIRPHGHYRPPPLAFNKGKLEETKFQHSQATSATFLESNENNVSKHHPHVIKSTGRDFNRVMTPVQGKPIFYPPNPAVTDSKESHNSQKDETRSDKVTDMRMFDAASESKPVVHINKIASPTDDKSRISSFQSTEVKPISGLSNDNRPSDKSEDYSDSKSCDTKTALTVSEHVSQINSSPNMVSKTESKFVNQTHKMIPVANVHPIVKSDIQPKDEEKSESPIKKDDIIGTTTGVLEVFKQTVDAKPQKIQITPNPLFSAHQDEFVRFISRSSKDGCKIPPIHKLNKKELSMLLEKHGMAALDDDDINKTPEGFNSLINKVNCGSENELDKVRKKLAYHFATPKGRLKFARKTAEVSDDVPLSSATEQLSCSLSSQHIDKQSEFDAQLSGISTAESGKQSLKKPKGVRKKKEKDGKNQEKPKKPKSTETKKPRVKSKEPKEKDPLRKVKGPKKTKKVKGVGIPKKRMLKKLKKMLEDGMTPTGAEEGTDTAKLSQDGEGSELARRLLEPSKTKQLKTKGKRKSYYTRHKQQNDGKVPRKRKRKDKFSSKERRALRSSRKQSLYDKNAAYEAELRKEEERRLLRRVKRESRGPSDLSDPSVDLLLTPDDSLAASDVTEILPLLGEDSCHGDTTDGNAINKGDSYTVYDFNCDDNASTSFLDSPFAHVGITQEEPTPSKAKAVNKEKKPRKPKMIKMPKKEKIPKTKVKKEGKGVPKKSSGKRKKQNCLAPEVHIGTVGVPEILGDNMGPLPSETIVGLQINRAVPVSKPKPRRYPMQRIRRRRHKEPRPVELKTDSSASLDKKRLFVCRETGETALHKAARKGYVEVALSYLDSGELDVNVRDNAGYTPLHESCVSGNLAIAKALIDRGADPNTKALDGTRPLHDAVDNNHLEHARLLLSHGADPTIANYGGRTPLKLARSTHMKDFLNDYMSDIRDESDPWEISAFVGKQGKDLGYDIMAGAPSDNEGDLDVNVIFDMSSEPHLPTLCLRIDDKLGFRNYHLAEDLAHRLGVDNTDDFALLNNDLTFLEHPKDDVLSQVDDNPELSSRVREIQKDPVSLVEIDDTLCQLLEVSRERIGAGDLAMEEWFLRPHGGTSTIDALGRGVLADSKVTLPFVPSSSPSYSTQNMDKMLKAERKGRCKDKQVPAIRKSKSCTSLRCMPPLHQDSMSTLTRCDSSPNVHSKVAGPKNASHGSGKNGSPDMNNSDVKCESVSSTHVKDSNPASTRMQSEDKSEMETITKDANKDAGKPQKAATTNKCKDINEILDNNTTSHNVTPCASRKPSVDGGASINEPAIPVLEEHSQNVAPIIDEESSAEEDIEMPELTAYKE